MVGIYLRFNAGPLFLSAGVPKPQASDRQPVRNRGAQQEVSGGQAREASSAVPHPLYIARITDWTIRLPHHPTPVRGKIVFHETGPWCQKGWGLLP